MTNVKQFDKMETNKTKKTGKPTRQNGTPEQKPKSKFTLFREKYPDGIGEIVNMRAVLR